MSEGSESSEGDRRDQEDARGKEILSELARLKWQCRRGMRELDELLLRYLHENYVDDSEADKAAFRELLALSDPELNGYLLQRQTPDVEPIARVIDRILRRNLP